MRVQVLVGPTNSNLADYGDQASLDHDHVSEQQQAHRKEQDGELWLLRKLLDIAVEDYRAGSQPDATPRQIANGNDALEWFTAADDPSGTGLSFGFVCDHLGLSAAWILENLDRARPSSTRRMMAWSGRYQAAACAQDEQLSEAA